MLLSCTLCMCVLGLQRCSQSKGRLLRRAVDVQDLSGAVHPELDIPVLHGPCKQHILDRYDGPCLPWCPACQGNKARHASSD